jgi:ribosome-binding ATPase YchF (GTP1/OBG family)
MQVGIVGAPNQGKSTFFNASSLAGAEMADYPFTTIGANQGVGYVRIKCSCKDFEKQCNPRQGWCTGEHRFISVTLLDVAGLVPDAHSGKGLGNQFLNDLSQTAVLVHVIDASGRTNDSGEKVKDYDPCNTIRFFEKEIDLWYEGILDKNWEKFARRLKQEKGKLSEQIARQFAGLGVTENQVITAMSKSNLPEDATAWSKENLLEFATKLRELAKPMLIVANKIDVEGAYENYEKMKTEFPQYNIIPASSENELALRRAEKAGIIEYAPGDSKFIIKDESKLNDKQKQALETIQHFLDKYKSTGVQQALNTAVLELLGYIAIFPGGVSKLEDSQGRTLPDVFLLPKDSTALDFAYTLHSDFGDHFIAAIDVRSKRKLGKDHKLNHRDVIELVAGK